MLQTETVYLAELFRYLEKTMALHPNSINLRGFAIENHDGCQEISLCELPWSVGTWQVLGELGFSNESKIAELGGLTWGEVLIKGGWIHLFEIAHNLLDWAPHAEGWRSVDSTNSKPR